MLLEALAGTTHRAAVDYAIKQSGFRYLFPGFVRGREHLPTAYLNPDTIPEWRFSSAVLSPESTARRAAMIEIYRGVVEPAILVCGIRCSTGGTPPSVRITRNLAPFFRCCRASR